MVCGQVRSAAKLAAEAMRFDATAGALTMLRVPAALSWRAAAPARGAVLARLSPSRLAYGRRFDIGCGGAPLNVG